MRIKLENIPLPEAYILAIGVGLTLQFFFPLDLLNFDRRAIVFGCLLITFGVLGSLWASFEAAEMRFSSPYRLITTGPYAYSRNPMYLSWSLIHAGIMILVSSVWLLVLLPIALVYVHNVDIRREEKFLQEKFGAEYDEYRAMVRRYL